METDSNTPTGSNDAVRVDIDISRQWLTLQQGGTVRFEAAVSTAHNGPGEVMDSECTPRGWHCIRAKIGSGQPQNTVFVARRPSGEIYTADLRRQHPDRDWILTRILWLSGMERGLNRLGDRDSMRRYIYIHGTPDDEAVGVAASKGCIRMRNEDILQLFELVEVGTQVYLHE